MVLRLFAVMARWAGTFVLSSITTVNSFNSSLDREAGVWNGGKTGQEEVAYSFIPFFGHSSQ
jgi:hypothetical protein